MGESSPRLSEEQFPPVETQHPLRRSCDDGLAAMAEGPQAALDHIRNKLQIILSRAELGKDTSQCESCVIAVSEIVKEIRDLEAFVREALQK